MENKRNEKKNTEKSEGGRKKEEGVEKRKKMWRK